ncbi:MAG: hypothetical protein HQL16_04340, partial [Candidatus Omnitrophica bacterium]|nr:hypothetical protein [Candidatus Omnitrophota bacterium]
MYTYFALSGLFNAIVSTLFGFFILYKDAKNNVNRTFAAFSFSVAAWSYAYIGWPLAHTAKETLFWFQLLHIGASFTPITYFHFVLSWLNISDLRNKIILYLGYGLACIFASTTFSNFFINGMVPKFSLKYWAVPGILYHYYLIYFFFYVFLSSCLLINFYKKNVGIKKQQIKFILIGISLSFLGGSTNYFLWYNINIPPYGNILASSFVALTFYAIVTYRLMDLRVAVTITGLFMVVYAFALGIPFYLFWKGSYLGALLSAIGLATAAPIIYAWLRRHAENKILQEERKYQEVLLTASRSISGHKTVDEIITAVVNVISRTIKPRSIAFYSFEGERFVLKKDSGDTRSGILELSVDSLIISFVKFYGIFSLDEVKSNCDMASNSKKIDEETIKFFSDRLANVAIAIKSGEMLLGVLFLGDKENGAAYLDRDFIALENFAFPVGLAIENAMHIAVAKKTIEEEYHDRRLRDIGLLGSAVAHQMANRLHRITTELGVAQIILNEKALIDDSREALVGKIRTCLQNFPAIAKDAMSARAI